MWSTCTQTLNVSLWFHLPRLTYQQKRCKCAAPAAAAAHICSIAGSFSQLSTAIPCLSSLKRGNRFVPTVGTEEKDRWGRTAFWPLEPGCVNLWHQLYLLLPANRMLHLPPRGGGLPRGTVLTPQVCPDIPKPFPHLWPRQRGSAPFLVTRPSSSPYFGQQAVSYISTNRIRSSPQGGKKSSSCDEGQSKRGSVREENRSEMAGMHLFTVEEKSTCNLSTLKKIKNSF